MFCFIDPKVSAAPLMVRVGLKERFEGVSRLLINQQKVSVGYCVNGVFAGEAVLSGGSFVFTPAAGFFYACNKEFPSLSEAKEAADRINAAGGEAYPCAVYRNTWLLYVGGGTKAEAEAARNKAIAATDLGFDLQVSDNGQRVMIRYGDGAILEDAGVMGLYLQFAPVYQNSSGIAVLELSAGESESLRSYRGRLEIGRYGKPSLTAVNVVELEEYLYSTVNCEMATEWPLEAQKAQAVASRSYAVSKMNNSPSFSLSNPYQLDDTTDSQVYKGAGFETEKSIAAVRATEGKTVTKDGKTIMAFFFSTSGGATENIKDVWDYENDYLRSVPDPYETEPEVLPWVVAFTKERLRSKLEGAGIYIGAVTDVTAENVTSSGRVNRLTIKGTLKSVTLETAKIRTVLGLMSTKFDIVKAGELPAVVFVVTADGSGTVSLSDSYFTERGGNSVPAPDIQQYVAISDGNLTGFSAAAPSDADTFYFVGMGWGHGVGLSQSGAAGMARAGYNYKQIIEYYYTGCKVQ